MTNGQVVTNRYWYSIIVILHVLISSRTIANKLSHVILDLTGGKLNDF